MPWVIIATGFTADDGREEVLSDYEVDMPDCPNHAAQVMGFARELGGGFAVCEEHAGMRRSDSTADRQL